MQPDEQHAPAGPVVLSVDTGQVGTRLDRFVADAFPGAGRAAVARLIAAGGVLVNGRTVRKGDPLRAGDQVQLSSVPGPSVAQPDAAVALRVLHEDGQVVVVDKPAGQPSHPLRSEELGTLASGLLARYPEMGEVGYHAREPGIVHRLDVGTSGLMLAARDPSSFAVLRRELLAGRIHKTYLAVCAGRVRAPTTLHGYLDASGPTVHVREQPTAGARAVTLEVIDSEPGARPDTSVVRVSAPFAGRHQIRAQLAAAGHPLLGDVRYGGPDVDGADELAHHLLHACTLRFTHPASGDEVAVDSGVPELFARFIRG